jgi:hypothetical protein
LSDLIKTHDLDQFFQTVSNPKNWQAIAAQMHLNADEAWEKFGQYFDRFKDMAVFTGILDSIIKLQCKTPCREAGGCSVAGNIHQCSALQCVKSKQYQGCWQCDEFESCDKLKFLKKNYGFVIEENLKTAREKGVTEVKSYGNRYYAWQRKKYGDSM